MNVVEYKQERRDPNIFLGHCTIHDKVCAFARKADRVLCRLSSHAIQEQANFLEECLGSLVRTLEPQFTHLSADKFSHALVVGQIIIR